MTPPSIKDESTYYIPFYQHGKRHIEKVAWKESSRSSFGQHAEWHALPARQSKGGCGKIEATTGRWPTCGRRMSGVDHRSEEYLRFLCRKKMAPPIIDIPMRINASELEMMEVDVPTATTPTITPAIENNNRIIRSSSHISRFGHRPFFRLEKILANIAPLQIHWNINEMGLLFRGGKHNIVREAQNCKNTTFIYVSCGKCERLR
jgi:hypothetical protein